jgi:hypothetical protein
LIYGMESLWEKIYRRVQAAIYAEQIFCSITTEMKYLPAFKDQPPLRNVHRENYETSYHLNTAAGNLARLLSGAHSNREERMLILMTIECFIEADEHDRKAKQFLRQVTAAEKKDGAWLEAAAHWHEQRVYWLQRAMKKLRSTIPASLWQEGASMAK